MKKYLSFRRIKEALGAIRGRFGVTLWLVVAFSVYLCALPWIDDVPRNVETAIGIGFPLAELISLTAYLWSETLGASAKRRNTLQAIGGAVALVNFLWLLSTSGYLSNSASISYASVFTALTAAIFFLPPQSQASAENQWNYSVSVLGAACFGLVLCIVMAIFVGLSTETVSLLFSLHLHKLTGTLFTLGCFTVPTLGILAYLPRKNADNMEAAGRPLALFCKNVLLPLAAAYTLILYAYGLKILFTFNLPQGSVCWMVTGLVSVSVLILFGVQGYLHTAQATEKGLKISQIVLKWLPTALLPLLVLMSVALLYRINQYGLTPKRLYMAAFNLWAYGAMLYLIFRREARFNVLAASFAALFLLSSIIPGFNFYTWGLNTVRAKVKAELRAHGVEKLPLSVDEFKAELSKMPREEAKSIADDIEWLDNYRDHSSVADIVMSKETIYRWEVLPDRDSGTGIVIRLTTPGRELKPIPSGYSGIRYASNTDYTYIRTNEAGFGTVELDDSLNIIVPLDSLAALGQRYDMRAVPVKTTGSSKSVFFITHIEIKADTTTAGEYSRINVGGYLLSK